MTDHNSQFMAILTATGEAKQANATALGIPWVITDMAVGDANGTDPMPQRSQTALINERHRAELTQLMIDEESDAMIIAELVIPEFVGGWWIREIGLYDEDGDLVVIANCPPTYKPELAQGSGRTQVIRLNIIVSSTQNIELKIDPSVVLATRDYVDKLLVRASQPEAEAGTNQVKLMTPLRTAQAIAALGLKTGTTAGTAAAGNDSRITGAVQTAGTGLSKTGTTLAVKYGTTAGTAVEGNDPRLSSGGEWSAEVVSRAEAESGIATAARKWTAQRVAQAIAALGLKLGTTAGTAAEGNDPRIRNALTGGTWGLARYENGLVGLDYYSNYAFMSYSKWVKVTRTFGVNYTNAMNWPIMISAYSTVSSAKGDRSLTLAVNGVIVSRFDTDSNSDGSVSAIVPPGAVYGVGSTNHTAAEISVYVTSS